VPSIPPCTVRSPRLPYTTLFRSTAATPDHAPAGRTIPGEMFLTLVSLPDPPRFVKQIPAYWFGHYPPPQPPCPRRARHARQWPRSEEHTSELQSRENLVCRLLLE